MLTWQDATLTDLTILSPIGVWNRVYGEITRPRIPLPPSPSAPQTLSSMSTWTNEDRELADRQANANWRRIPWLTTEGGLITSFPGGVTPPINIQVPENPFSGNTWDSLIWKSALVIGGMLVVGIVINRR